MKLTLNIFFVLVILILNCFASQKLFEEGVGLYSSGNHAEAVKKFNDFLTDPAAPADLKPFAYIYLAQMEESVDEKINLFFSAAHSAQNKKIKANALKEAAQLLMLKGDFNKANVSLSAAANLLSADDEDYIEFKLKLALSFMHIGNLNKAQDILNDILKSAAAVGEYEDYILIALGDINYSKENYEEALHNYLMVPALKPSTKLKDVVYSRALNVYEKLNLTEKAQRTKNYLEVNYPSSLLTAASGKDDKKIRDLLKKRTKAAGLPDPEISVKDVAPAAGPPDPEISVKDVTPPELIEPAVKTGNYAVQVFASHTLSSARNFQKRMANLGYNSEIFKGTFQGKDIYRVKIGAFHSSSDANNLLNELKSKNIDGFITKR